jgi:hypothetical protein
VEEQGEGFGLLAMDGRGRGGRRSGGARVGEGPCLEEREGHAGCAWKTLAGRGGGGGGEENWAGPEETVKVLIYLNNSPTSQICFDQKVDLPSSKILK